MRFIVSFKKISRFLIIFLFILPDLKARAQSPTDFSQKILDKVDKYNEKFPTERLFLHLDKTCYAVGDTLWFKAYLVNAKIAYSALSSRLYVDLINDSSKIVKHYTFPVAVGLTDGNISLDEKLVHEGAYTIRAYTNWMKNFGDDQYFYRHFYIVGSENPDLNKANSFPRPPKHTGAGDVGLKNPGNGNPSAGIDLQFMPESGPLVELLPAHIAFKAIDENGLGTAVNGVVMDKENNIQARFGPVHNGMGVFDFVPQQDETYTAKITLAGGGTKMIALPAVKTSGTLLSIRSDVRADMLEINIYGTPGMLNSKYALTGQTGQQVYYAGVFELTRDFLTVRIPKSLFPTGITHFTLFDSQGKPLNERPVFINHHDNFKISVSTDGQSFNSRDSIPLNITAKDVNGNPVTGSFSVGVTDDSKINPSDLADQNILTRLLLESDLKGYVENPAYYFTEDIHVAEALDILLLTQGWTNYNWNDILNEEVAPIYPAEPEFMIRGKVSSLLDKPVVNSEVTLLGVGKHRIYKDTTTDTEGKFIFKNFPLIDTAMYVLQARNAKGRIVNAGISIEENQIPPVVLPPYPAFSKAADTAIINFAKNGFYDHNKLNDTKYGPGIHVLQTVDIKGKAIIKGSKNLNGAGNYDQAVTVDEIEKAGKISLLSLIEQKIKGFHEGHLPKDNNLTFMMLEKRVHFVIDGIDLDKFYDPVSGIQDEHYNYQKETLDYLSAADITGIEVFYSTKYNALYNDRNLTTEEQLAIAQPGLASKDVAYLEITTRAGNGPFTKQAKGILVYKPEPVSLPLQFYRPRYPVNNIAAHLIDMRSTIHWEPNIITNKSGVAFTSFYAADHPATYTITIQGADLKGNIGCITRKITITAK